VRRADPEDVLDAYEDFFHDELLPAIGGPPHTAMAFVGYSFGAHLVTSLALGEERARALATLGGAGIARAARAAGTVVASRLAVAMFHNAGDELPPPATAVSAFDPRLAPWVMPARPGGHGFQSYASNGSVAEAFGFALDLLG
jgi:dienelactone hydrolase